MPSVGTFGPAVLLALSGYLFGFISTYLKVSPPLLEPNFSRHKRRTTLPKPILPSTPPRSHQEWQLRRAAIEKHKIEMKSLEQRNSCPSPATPDAEVLPPRLVRAEAVLRSRIGPIVLVIPNHTSAFDACACLRTAEGMGVQHVWLVLGPGLQTDEVIPGVCEGGRGRNRKEKRNVERLSKVVKGASQWLTLRTFESPHECALALKGLFLP